MEADKCTFFYRFRTVSLFVRRWPRSTLFLDRFRLGSLRMRRVDAETLSRILRVGAEILLRMRKNGAESSLCMWRCGAEILLDLSGYAVGDHQLEMCNTWSH